MELINPEEYGSYYNLAQRRGLLNKHDSAVIFYDLSILQNRIDLVKLYFGGSFRHSVAIKSNPLIASLKYLEKQKALVECASFGEVELALHAGFTQERIVLDSPAKTQVEIGELEQNDSKLIINVDSFQELERYSNTSTLNLGLRINPLVNASGISSMNVSGVESKFGVSLENTEMVANKISKYQSIQRLHVHAGSQFSQLQPTVGGIRKIIDLAVAINQINLQQIKEIDIGGGFPVNYKGAPFDIRQYALLLQKDCPELFDNTFTVITEFGRYYHANAGWVLSNIEYVKEESNNLVINVGADMFLREAYNPRDWHHNMHIIDPLGHLKTGSEKKYHIAGPLCFGGDYVDKNRSLPIAHQNDKLIIADCGANTFSLWSRHCSRPFPKVIMYSSSKNGEDMFIAKNRENTQDLINFWN